jgi:ubiquinone/menaquinone biosynthesis C-methylase UbiE
LLDWKSKRKVMRSYDVTSEMYDERYKDEQKRKYKKALESIETACKAVLDVGCGSGLFFPEIASDVTLVVGVDVSHNLLLKARRQADEFSNVHLLQADADNLPFIDRFYDAVFSFTVLQNLPNPKKTLCELERVTKFGGEIALTGLKKAFPLEKFMDILEGSSFKVVSFSDNESINCYIAVLAH